MTEEQRKEYLNQLFLLAEDTYDTEGNHIAADGIICDILRLLGYNDIVSAYNEIDKGYGFY